MNDTEKGEKNVKRYSFTAGDRMQEMIEELMEYRGYRTLTALVTQGLVEMYREMGRDSFYVNKAKGAPTRKKDEPVAGLSKGEKKQLKICEELGGTVGVDGSGVKVCTFYTYTHKSRYEQNVPLDQLDEELVKNQYFPSRERVEEYQKKKQTDYDD